MKSEPNPGPPIPLRGTERPPSPGQPPAECPELAPKVRPDLAKNPEDVWRLAEHMLIEGATFEDVIEEAARRGGKIEIAEVESFFLKRPEVQQKRVRRLIEKSAQLAAALGGRKKAETALARAAILTGLQRLRSADAHLSTKDALKAHMDDANLSLKEQLMRWQKKLRFLRAEFEKARKETEQARADLVRLQSGRLRRLLDQLERKPNLDVDAVKKIREIYGLLSTPSQRAMAAAVAENEK